MCVVALRWATDNHGNPLGKATLDPFGDKITQKEDVQERIRRAQLAILNPSIDSKTFLQEADYERSSNELSFSRNSVYLDISGPDVADLSFCDLPGLIASSGSSGSASDIAVILGLVKSFCSSPSCVILLTVACETDFMNQGAHEVAKQLDPLGKRTIGVLTKPDRIAIGDEGSWIPLIKNEKEVLVNNWFAVKQPNIKELQSGISWQEARNNEKSFFAGTASWASLDPIYKKYLGTDNLVKRLSSILSDLISRRLPEIQVELQNSIRETENALGRLPKPPSQDPFSDIMEMLHRFSNDLAKHAEGIPAAGGLLQTIRPDQDKFRQCIRMTAPKFRPYERQHDDECHLPKSDFLSNEGEEDDGSDEGESITEYRPSERLQMTKFIYIDEVLARMQDARTRELPGNFPYIVQEKFIADIVSSWLTPALELCASVHKTLNGQIQDVIHKHFHEFGQGTLEHSIKILIQGHMNDCFKATESKLRWVHDLEKRPFTLNTHYLRDYKEKFMVY